MGSELSGTQKKTLINTQNKKARYPIYFYQRGKNPFM